MTERAQWGRAFQAQGAASAKGRHPPPVIGHCPVLGPVLSAEHVIRYLTLTSAPEVVLLSSPFCTWENWSREMKSLDKRAGTGLRQLSSRDHTLYHDTFDKMRSHLRKQQSQDLIHPPCQGMFHSTAGHLKPRGDGKTCTQGKANDKCKGQAGAPD